MIAYQLICDQCAKIFEQNEYNCIPEAVKVLNRLDSEVDNGKQMLCPDCMDAYTKKLADEDRYQTEGL